MEAPADGSLTHGLPNGLGANVPARERNTQIGAFPTQMFPLGKVAVR